jgi:Flp pilus assembly protein TadD
LDAALAAAPDDPRALLSVADDLLLRGRANAAARLMERAVQVAPGYAAARAALAVALDGLGLEGRGAKLASETATLLPTSPTAVREAARSARRNGRHDEAAWLLRKAISLRFDDAEARGSLAQLLLDRGDLDGAVALLAEGLRVHPGNLDAVLRLAATTTRSGSLPAPPRRGSGGAGRDFGPAAKPRRSRTWRARSRWSLSGRG